MKKKEFEAIGKRLLPDLPGFAVKGDLLLLRPLGHTLRGICFNRSIDPRSFYMEIFLQPLFVPFPCIAFSIGWRLRRASGRSDSWSADDPHLIEELRVGLTREAVPFLSRIQTPQDVADAACTVSRFGGTVKQGVMAHASNNARDQEIIAYALARAGEVARACDVLDRLVTTSTAGVPWKCELVDRAAALKSQLLNDPAAAQRQLDAWEAETVRNLGLEEFR